MTLRKPSNTELLIDEIPADQANTEEIITLLKIIIEHLSIITDEILDEDDIE